MRCTVKSGKLISQAALTRQDTTFPSSKICGDKLLFTLEQAVLGRLASALVGSSSGHKRKKSSCALTADGATRLLDSYVFYDGHPNCCRMNRHSTVIVGVELFRASISGPRDHECCMNVHRKAPAAAQPLQLREWMQSSMLKCVGCCVCNVVWKLHAAQ